MDPQKAASEDHSWQKNDKVLAVIIVSVALLSIGALGAITFPGLLWLIEDNWTWGVLILSLAMAWAYFHHSKKLTESNSALHSLTKSAKSIAEGNLDIEITSEEKEEEIGIALEKIASQQKRSHEALQQQETLNKEIDNQNWLKTHVAKISDATKGVVNIQELSSQVISELSPHVGAGMGAFFVNQRFLDINGEEKLKMEASYAYSDRKKISNVFKFGEGLIGQCALEKKVITVSSLPTDYTAIQSGIGESVPKQLMVMPVLHNGDVLAVMELGFTARISNLQDEYLKEVVDGLGVTLNAAIERAKTESLSREINNQIQAINRSNAAIEFDVNGYILTANQLFLDLMGYKLDEIKGKHHSIFVDKDYAETDEYKRLWEGLRKGEFNSDVFERFTKEGNSVWIQGNYNPIVGADGKPYKVMKIATDITESIHEKARVGKLSREMNSQMTAINRSNAVIEFDLSGNILTANQIFLDLMGYELDEVVGKHHSIFVDPIHAKSDEYKQWWLDFENGQFVSDIFKRFSKSGKEVWIQGNYNPLFNGDGKPYKVLKMASDVTETRQQQILIQETNEKLKAQEEELRVSNEELTHQTEMLKASEEELRVQQEELAQVNTELEEKAQLLEEQNQSVSEKNEALNQAREALDIKAKELESSSKYKSEFLANMSHELRTPLNSILILSKLMQDNKTKNLTEKQLEFSTVIHKSGSDLLKLINEVLDLAKVESGKIELELEDHNTKLLADDMGMAFKALSLEKNINFNIDFDDSLPETFVTDKLRLEQILKNLLSNAFKFTPEEGSIQLSFRQIEPLPNFTREELMKSKSVLEIAVKDSGIGIPKQKHHTVFQAFQQADGSTQRKYGGTGLGLSISKELAEILGGELLLESEEGNGATFTVYLPFSLQVAESLTVNEATEKANEVLSEARAPEPIAGESIFGGKGKTFEAVIADDRDTFSDSPQSVLIVEDDLKFAKVLLDLAREKGFKGIVVNHGDMALKHVEAYRPNSIILDMKLPGTDGWTILKELKKSPFANIPVHIMSGMDKQRLGLDMGAVDYLKKPISADDLDGVFIKMKGEVESSIKHLLIIEDDERQNMAIKELVSQKQLNAHSVYGGADALRHLNENPVDLAILDIELPDMNGIEVLQEIRKKQDSLPIIIFTGKDLSKAELAQIRKLNGTSVILKTDNSHQRLLDETELFIHQIGKTNGANGNGRAANGNGHAVNGTNGLKPKNGHFKPADSLEGRKILMVDDDMRNIYALQTILEGEGIDTSIATNGFEAVEAVKEDPEIEAVLMDIMMPEMDGYEATRRIREMGKKDLPIIALTAKAMKGDREKSLEAGLSDYMSKPIDVEKLIALLKVWMHK